MMKITDYLNLKHFTLKRVVLGGAIFLGGALFFGGVNSFFAYTNRMEFCISCHSMQTNFQEYQQTVHYKNASGVQATCADCHVPKEFFPKLKAKIWAAKDVYHEIMGTVDTPEKYEAHRWNMASQVWAKMEASDSRECRNCHNYDNMDMSQQQRLAKQKHSRASIEGKSCIECHKGIAHKLPDEPEQPPAAEPAAAAPASP